MSLSPFLIHLKYALLPSLLVIDILKRGAMMHSLMNEIWKMLSYQIDINQNSNIKFKCKHINYIIQTNKMKV